MWHDANLALLGENMVGGTANTPRMKLNAIGPGRLLPLS